MGEGKVEMEEDKVKGILKWPTPQCVRDVRKFLGLTNYYRQFVKGFAKVALPMNRLMRKDEKWKWGEEQQAAFKQLKAVFTTRPTLATPELVTPRDPVTPRPLANQPFPHLHQQGFF